MEVLRSEICRREKIIQDKLCKFKGSNVQKGFLEGGLHEIQDLKEIYFKIQNLQMIEENENKAMKKHEVPIPSGYEVESVSPCTEDAGLNMISTTVVFQKIKKELPKTWQQYSHKTSNFIPAWLMEINEDIPAKYRALGRLEILRDVYNDGRVPDWNEGYKYKFCIEIVCDKIRATKSHSSQRTLTFSGPELRDKFLSNFIELIETAKPLL